MREHIPHAKEAVSEAGLNFWRLIRMAGYVIAAWLILPYLLKAFL